MKTRREQNLLAAAIVKHAGYPSSSGMARDFTSETKRLLAVVQIQRNKTKQNKSHENHN